MIASQFRTGLRAGALATALLIVFAGFAPAALAQQAQSNKANWKLADRYTSEALRPYVYSSQVTPGWINQSETFWYSWRDRDGVRYWLVDAKARSKKPLFDHDKMATLLSEAMKKPMEAKNLALTTITFDEKGELMRFGVENVRFEFDLKKETLKETGRSNRPAGTGGPPGGIGQGGRGGGGRGGGGGFGGQGGQAANLRDGFRNYAPDRKVYVYAMEHNLYFVDTADETKPVQLTTDGVKDYGFGSAEDRNRIQQQFQQQQQQQQQEQQQQEEGQTQQGQGGQQAQEKRVRANATWSPDSKNFTITRSDQRKVGELFLVNALAVPRPTITSYKYTMPGEENVSLQEIFLFTRDGNKIQKLDFHKWKDQSLYDLHWDQTGERLRFVRRDRLQRNLDFCDYNTKTGETKVLLSEGVEDSNLERQNVRYLKPGGDFVWWSERSGWGHYYLYDHDGKLRNAVTSGEFRADSVVELVGDKDTLYFRGYGRETGENPYYGHLYRVGLNGKGLTLLDAGDADHSTSLSPNKKFAVDNFSKVDLTPKAVLRDESGKVVMDLETMDLSRLTEMGWKAPETFSVKAADGVTDIYGVMWKPFDFDAKKKYPVIAHVYPGPQTESVTAAFSPTNNNQRLAQLGFIVIQIGNRGGSPRRSNAYHSYGYYNLRDYGLADKKAGIEQLGARHAWIDVDKVGIYGHSGGGFMTAAALMLPPYNDFFKVGVSSSGNHDNNIYNQNWSEQNHGMKAIRTPKPGTAATQKTGGGGPSTGDQGQTVGNGGANVNAAGNAATTGAARASTSRSAESDDGYDVKFEIKVPSNEELAPNLKGNLLLVTGDMDNNVHPANTLRLVNALIKANKRFDFMVMPGQAHGYGQMQSYFTQRMMEYFAEHLLGDYYRGGADMSGKGGGP